MTKKSVSFSQEIAKEIGVSPYVEWKVNEWDVWISRGELTQQADKDVAKIRSGCVFVERRGLETLLDGTRKRLITEHVRKIIKKSKSLLCTEKSFLGYLLKTSEKQATRAQKVALEDELEAQRYQREHRVLPRVQVRQSLDKMQKQQAAMQMQRTQQQQQQQRISMPTKPKLPISSHHTHHPPHRSVSC